MFLSFQLLRASDLGLMGEASFSGNVSDFSELSRGAIQTIAGLLDIRNVDKALPMLSDSTSKNAEANALYLKGLEALYTKEDYDLSIKWLKDSLAVDPNFASALAVLGTAYRKKYADKAVLDDLRLAEAFAEAAIQKNEKNIQSLLLMAGIFKDTGRFGLANSYYALVLNSDRDNIEALLGKARSLRSMGKYGDSEELFEKLLLIQPHSWKVRVSYGLLFIQQRRFSEARNQFKHAIDLRPLHPAAYTDVANSYFYEEAYSKAEKYFLASISVKDTFYARKNLGSLYYQLGRLADAIEQYSVAVDLNDTFYRVWADLAQVKLYAGVRGKDLDMSYIKAITLIEDHLRVNPIDNAAKAKLAELYGIFGKRSKSLEMLVDLETQFNGISDIDILSSISATYETIGDRKSSFKWLQSAYEKGFRIRLPPVPQWRALVESQEFKTLITKY